MFEHVEWVRSDRLSNHELGVASSWIRELDVEFFSSFDIPTGQLDVILSKLLQETGNELSSSEFFRIDGRIGGFFSGFSSAEIFPRRMVLLKSLLMASPSIEESRARLSRFAPPVRSVVPESFYLSKLYIDRQFRGTALSPLLLNRFECRRDPFFSFCTLNVERSNMRAISFYRKHGYADLDADESASAYFTMVKRIGG